LITTDIAAAFSVGANIMLLAQCFIHNDNTQH